MKISILLITAVLLSGGSCQSSKKSDQTKSAATVAQDGSQAVSNGGTPTGSKDQPPDRQVQAASSDPSSQPASPSAGGQDPTNTPKGQSGLDPFTEVWQLAAVDGKAREQEADHYTLRFYPPNIMRFKLDKNSCEINYHTHHGGSIHLKNVGCTEMCCDSPEALALLDAFLLLNTYSVDGERLIMRNGSAGMEFALFE